MLPVFLSSAYLELPVVFALICNSPLAIVPQWPENLKSKRSEFIENLSTPNSCDSCSVKSLKILKLSKY
jgi:hypothetical protein